MTLDELRIELIVCPEFVAGDRVIRTVGMLLYPADDVAEQFFRAGR